jgi:hypothetical protein
MMLPVSFSAARPRPRPTQIEMMPNANKRDISKTGWLMPILRLASSHSEMVFAQSVKGRRSGRLPVVLTN